MQQWDMVKILGPTPPLQADSPRRPVMLSSRPGLGHEAPRGQIFLSLASASALASKVEVLALALIALSAALTVTHKLEKQDNKW